MNFVYVPNTADMELTLLHKSINNYRALAQNYGAMYTTVLQRVFQSRSRACWAAAQSHIGESTITTSLTKISSGVAMSLTTSGPRILRPFPKIKASLWRGAPDQELPGFEDMLNNPDLLAPVLSMEE